MKKKISVKTVVDIVCPWCFVGKTNLMKALELGKDQYDFEVSFLPFQLDPNTPKAGVPRAQYLQNKFGNLERFQMAEARVQEAAQRSGAPMHFEKIQTQINTFDCHRLIWWAGTRGKQVAVANAIYKAYYIDGLDLSKLDILAGVVEQEGFDRNETEAFLKSEEGFNEIKALMEEVYSLGITGVPFFILNDEVGISGAQSSEVFLEAFAEVAGSSI